MIPLGTGIMKLYYDPKQHNQHKFGKDKLKLQECQDIIEKRLRDKNVSKKDYHDFFNSNLINGIN